MGHALNDSIQDCLIRYQPDARPADEVDPRHRPRRHRDADARSSARSSAEGTSREELGREAFVRARLGVARAVRRHDHRAAQAPRAPRATTPRSASRSTRRYAQAVLQRVRRAVREGLHLPRPLHGQLGSRQPARRSPTSRSRTARSPTRSTTSTTRWPRAAARSRSPRCAPRRCSPTPRSRSTPTTSATARLIGEKAILPLVGRKLKIIADEYVKPEFGTGALKITPGHDPNDFEIGRRHGLAQIAVIGEDGRITDEAPERFVGLTVSEAQRGGRRRAPRAGPDRARPRTTPTTVPFSHRSGERIEPLISLQWFMRDGRARRAGDRGGDQRPDPLPPRAAGRRVYLDWMREHPAVVHLAPAVVGPPAAGLVPRASETYVGTERARGRGLGRATPTCSTPGSRARCGRSRRSAGPSRRPSCAPSTRPTRSSPRATSSSSGSRG